jgi:hypothetical protein
VPRPVDVAELAAAFTSGFNKKSEENRNAVRKALRLMAQDLGYPSLRTQKMGGRPNVWEARASQSVRITFDFVSGETIRLRTCCTHDIYRSP